VASHQNSQGSARRKARPAHDRARERLQASERRNLSLQPSEILPHPIPPFDLVHVSPPCRWDAALSHCPAGSKLARWSGSELQRRNSAVRLRHAWRLKRRRPNLLEFSRNTLPLPLVAADAKLLNALQLFCDMAAKEFSSPRRSTSAASTSNRSEGGGLPLVGSLRSRPRALHRLSRYASRNPHITFTGTLRGLLPDRRPVSVPGRMPGDRERHDEADKEERHSDRR
jgi:hypothetical protein